MIRRRIAYGLAFFFAIVAFIGTNSPVAHAAVVTLVLLLVSSIATCMVAASRIGLSFQVPASCEVGSDLALAIKVRKQRLMPMGGIECKVTCHNILMHKTETIMVELGAMDKTFARFDLPLKSDECGRIELEVEAAYVFDPLGLYRRRINCRYASSYAVYPHVLDLVVPLERSPHASFAGMVYDTRRRGQDMSEPFDIRDYRTSDPLRAIHWKLSSKFDRLLVREASHPSSYEVLLLVDAGLYNLQGDLESTKTMTAVLDLAASLSYELCRQGLGHNVAFVGEESLSDCMVDSAASFEEMLDIMVGTPLPHSNGVNAAMFEIYRRERSFTKTVLVTCSADEALFTQIGASTDLSVVHITTTHVKAVEETPSFSLTSIPIEDVATHVKSVVI